MAREFILRNRPGYDLREAVENPTFENALIFEYEKGYLKAIHPVTPTTLYMYKPVPPPEYYRDERIGKTIIPKYLPDGYFASGASPFVQAIVRVVEGTALTFPEIYQRLLSYRIFPDSGSWKKRIKWLVKWMSGKVSYLTYYKEKRKTYFRVGVGLSLRPPVVSYRGGVDPIDDQISSFVEDSGSASYLEIREHIMDRLGWLESPSYLDESLQLLVKNGYLEKVGEDVYRHIRRVDKFLRY